MAAWAQWATLLASTSGFKMATEYRILTDPSAISRYFQTDPAEEHKFLTFKSDVNLAVQGFARYNVLSGISVIMLIMRILKALDFQPRLGLVTRTVAKAASDLTHFAILFAVVFVGYGFVGVQLFGHQFQDMRNPSVSMQTLASMLLSFDPTLFHAEMTHALGDQIGKFTLDLYIWSYMVICYFILLNIFLAILVDAYAEVKESMGGSHSVLQELVAVFS
eukprot:CAMPEP_0180328794 /NCGR_PEP_ID=MMETSP0988-20121125/40408_1 /TAXON_ID=697907 /ORGANISM="non described non described, Strain CCMP2293" /LENGTH=219 /DNA_ID=CAMNT_0022315835 /DNA_START=48 /DNA_END=703 /DNA_ORIENTATION=+